MEQFNLDKYLENSWKKVVTRDGRSVRIICTDKKGVEYPIVALIKMPINNEEKEIIHTFTKNGHWLNLESISDLFFAPEKKEGWVNIYADICQSRTIETDIYVSKEDAEKVGKVDTNYIATVKIEWEE